MRSHVVVYQKPEKVKHHTCWRLETAPIRATDCNEKKRVCTAKYKYQQ